MTVPTTAEKGGVDLLALASRCEELNGNDLLGLTRLNADILRALGWTSDNHNAFNPDGVRALSIPQYTRSLDDAASLVPADWVWQVNACGTATVFLNNLDAAPLINAFSSTHPVLALCAAALKARATQHLTKGED